MSSLNVAALFEQLHYAIAKKSGETFAFEGKLPGRVDNFVF